MSQFINILRVVGQSLLIVIFILAGSVLFEFRIPGHQTFTDNDAGLLALVYKFFIIIGILLLFNSLIFMLKNHWKKFRIGVLIFVISFGLAVFLPREVIKWTFFGGEKMEFTSLKNPDFIWVKLELYKNNGFLCSTSYAGEMTEETIGIYKLKNNLLELHLKNGISEHAKNRYQTLYENIGTKYRIKNDTLIC